MLHAIRRLDGQLVRRAHYTMLASATIDACLREAGWHRMIGAVPGFVAIRGGSVIYRNQRWSPPGVVVLADGRAIGVAEALPLLGG